MFSCRKALTRGLTSAVAVLVMVASQSAMPQTAYPGVGRAATPKEVKAWDKTRELYWSPTPDLAGQEKGLDDLLAVDHET